MKIEKTQLLLNQTLNIKQMNKFRIFGIVFSLMIAIVFLFKINYSNLNLTRNGTYFVIITSALTLFVSNVVTWVKKNKK